ncbi:MAG: hypothetical protein UT34_C0001G0139 [candidate division WS6 bacterium GW2011_GWF2_39_15]|uniref:CDP-diacylglycerol-glycerol-3-phosphate 3-phosphatidyltransferase n=1 Tax=candidate division WS6 bacterium GW2011_GWF2_39_15 TaxID=1619100 RepID=A0A0G0MQ01_9BACT|nr:MAG: hypothetical protein UT34_C0001G0139 [candidate division WS6 bacterium GW2011_GWF2_39_15]
MASVLEIYKGNKYVKLVIILRLLGYLVIPFKPLEGILLSMFLDCVDWWILSWGGIPKRMYHVLDKPLDYIQYLVMLIPLFHTPIFPAYALLLLWRTIGLIIYTKKHSNKIFALFPNVAELLALIYLISEKFNLNINVLDFKILFLLLVIKVIQEFWLHYFSRGVTYQWIYNLRKILSQK